jgi:hypothetical protein
LRERLIDRMGVTELRGAAEEIASRRRDPFRMLGN